MLENLGFWLWVLLMLFIAGVAGSLGYLVWWSERRGVNDAKRYLPNEDPHDPTRPNGP